ncbi:MAG: SMP-30/gluconolactonase/LRE family protein [Opitutus sp.]|nr:SMP-30/gluconolactonase/LRE family protein [Opitutus sp.]MCS6246572.1 SMP-30/gluconolactonase/LRE family protein [Opitutus sp.]MCS6272743.1 SMP-30/gluconolactonase/LRE family protein [Opitutus sp.]MCS6276375.1 SMP-30/gluconolactonase/LRE family protein [Opitutus sp.]MCS6301977.1 SMP-30/gluconolactonase/LRE family protein [Opitutus sp.]
MIKLLSSLVTLWVFIAACCFGAEEHPVLAPGAQLEKLAGGFKFTEGATCDPQGNVFFVDQPNNRIHRWSTDGKLSTFMDPAGRANGMCFDSKGMLFVCADEKNELWAVTADGKASVLAQTFGDKRLNGPNDVYAHPSGALYFTDPYYPRPWWGHKIMPQPSQQVYRLSADRQHLVKLTDDLKQPNGIVGTPDGKRLFVADIGAKRTWVYEVQADGTLTNKKLFCEMGSDGMTLDTQGNIYLTGKGVTVFDKSGVRISQIEVPENWTANICFGGADRQTLFITASTGLYSVRTQFKGANPGK